MLTATKEKKVKEKICTKLIKDVKNGFYDKFFENARRRVLVEEPV